MPPRDDMRIEANPYIRHCVVCKEDLPMEDAEEFRLHLLGHVAEALFNIDDRLGRIEGHLDDGARDRR